MTLVVDASIALAWAYADEHSPVTAAVLDRVMGSGAWVPSIWRLEIANGLLQSVRRGRIDKAYRAGVLEDFGDLPISVDPDTGAQAWTGTLQLAERHRLTVYDAAYLELADRLGLPLATLDTELRRVATEQGVPLFGAS